jgi:hypothetical protein
MSGEAKPKKEKVVTGLDMFKEKRKADSMKRVTIKVLAQLYSDLPENEKKVSQKRMRLIVKSTLIPLFLIRSSKMKRRKGLRKVWNP